MIGRRVIPDPMAIPAACAAEYASYRALVVAQMRGTVPVEPFLRTMFRRGVLSDAAALRHDGVFVLFQQKLALEEEAL